MCIDAWVIILTEFCTQGEMMAFSEAFPMVSRCMWARIKRISVGTTRECQVLEKRGVSFPNLLELTVDSSIPEEFCRILKIFAPNRHLTTLCITNCLLGHREVVATRRIIEKNQSLQHLCISPFITEYQGSEDLAEVRRLLRHFGSGRSLRSLTLTSMRSDLVSWNTSTGSTLLRALAPPGPPVLVNLRIDGILPSAVPVSDFICALNSASALRILWLGNLKLMRFARPVQENPVPDLYLPCLRALTLHRIRCPDTILRIFLNGHVLSTIESLHVRYPSSCIDIPRIRLCHLHTLEILEYELKSADLDRLMTACESSRLENLTLGGFNTPMCTASLYHKICRPTYIPTLRRVILVDHCPDSYTLKLSWAFRKRNVSFSWKEKGDGCPSSLVGFF